MLWKCIRLLFLSFICLNKSCWTLPPPPVLNLNNFLKPTLLNEFKPIFKPVLFPELKPIIPDLQQSNLLFQQQLIPPTPLVRNYVGDPEADMTVVS